MHRVLISLGSFGAAEVRRHGQLWFARLAHAAGADGVEVRGELLADAAAELPALARLAAGNGLDLVYSSPEGLWREDGSFDRGAFDRAGEAAAVVGARRVKMAIGGFRASSSVAALQDALAAGGVELLVENDQTAAAGTLPALQRFFAAASALPLSMTFDIGNWHWTGECPLQAAQALASRVGYVHCKGVQRRPDQWVAVPLADSAAPWRAVLRALPAGVPWAIEHPLAGEDLLATTRSAVAHLRSVAAAQSLHA